MTVLPFNQAVTGFGTVPFRLAVDQVWGTAPDFSSEPILVSRHVPGSNVTLTQKLGMRPRRVTFDIWLDTRADYNALLPLLGTLKTLTLIDGLTSVPGTTFARNGTLYVSLPNVLFVSMTGAQYYIAGEVEAQATFEVAYA